MLTQWERGTVASTSAGTSTASRSSIVGRPYCFATISATCLSLISRRATSDEPRRPPFSFWWALARPSWSGVTAPAASASSPIRTLMVLSSLVRRALWGGARHAHAALAAIGGRRREAGRAGRSFDAATAAACRRRSWLSDGRRCWLTGRRRERRGGPELTTRGVYRLEVPGQVRSRPDRQRPFTAAAEDKDLGQGRLARRPGAPLSNGRCRHPRRSPAESRRVASVDALRGLVMVVMALDHTRDYFHSSAILFDPEDLARTSASAALFFTRWVTHFCAPVFMLTAGLGAYFWRAGGAHDGRGLSRFLVTRGLWLVVLELTALRLAYSFGLGGPVLLTILWALGLSMVVLAALVHLPVRALAALSLAVVVLHNLADSFRPDSWPWKTPSRARRHPGPRRRGRRRLPARAVVRGDGPRLLSRFGDVARWRGATPLARARRPRDDGGVRRAARPSTSTATRSRGRHRVSCRSCGARSTRRRSTSC